MSDFRNLRAWREAVQLAVVSREVIKKLPDCERFALADQWRRAAYGVSLNIVEGASRRGVKEFRRYLDIALSSLHEIEGIIALVEAMEYVNEADLAAVVKVRDDCAKMVFGLLRAMSSRLEPAKRRHTRGVTT